jgi:hypothetical protein
MSTEDFIVELFCRVDDQMRDVPKHSQSRLYPSEIVTLALLFSLKGTGERAFYRWIVRDWLAFFPQLPERTRLFRQVAAHQDWIHRFLASPTVLGVADSFGVELRHPIREGRRPGQIGKKGLSNHRWIVGGKLALVLNKFGLACGWDCDTANVHDSRFHPLVRAFERQMIVLADQSFHAAAGDPENLKICQHNTWNVRMLIETVLSMLTRVCHFKRQSHRVWRFFQAHLGWTVALFNILVQWNGLQPDEHGHTHLAIAQFSL